jgi:sporulation protein YlmC with PRC-barrel domain
MNRSKIVLTAFFAVMLLIGTAFAGGGLNSKNMGAMHESTYSKDQLMGLSVYDKSGHELGKIDDVSINDDTKNVNFVTIAKGGVMGIGEEEHAVPLEALRINLDNRSATFTASADKLEATPKQTFGQSDEEFSTTIYKYYGISPAWGEGSEPHRVDE